jgi:hypothetical protein
MSEKLTSQVVKEPRGPYSPYFGCLIFSVLILVVLFVGGMAYYSLRRADHAEKRNLTHPEH